MPAKLRDIALSNLYGWQQKVNYGCISIFHSGPWQLSELGQEFDIDFIKHKWVQH